MVPERLGMAAVEVALETISQALCAAGVLYILLYTSVGWFLPSSLISIITILCLIAGLSSLLYFRIKKVAGSSDELATFLSWLQSGRCKVIAHRGGAADAPENTLVALQEAKKSGAVGVEVDVEMTKDGVAVLMHDATVDRTTDGTGFIGQLMWEDVRQLNAAAKFSSSRSQYTYESIPTLDEVIQECLNLKLKIFFDVKAYSKQMVEEIVRLYQKYPELYGSAMVCSFFPTTIYGVRQLDTGILTALTTESYFICEQVKKRLTGPVAWWKMLPFAVLDKFLTWSVYSWLWVLCGNSAVLLNKDTVSAEVVRYWSARGMVVIPWTVNAKTEKEFFSHLGCQYITDYVK